MMLTASAASPLAVWLGSTNLSVSPLSVRSKVVADPLTLSCSRFLISKMDGIKGLQ